jgi:hypothetical protein
LESPARPGGNGHGEEEVTFLLGKKHGRPAKLVYSGRTYVLVEVPFVLKDVPLP